MWILQKEFKFEASHVLPNHDGKCSRLHGHSWRFIVKISGDTLAKSGAETGMVVDFSKISNHVKPLLDENLDHHHLNATLEMKNPTCEKVSRWIFNKLKPLIPNLYSVVVFETCTSGCEYYE